MTRRSGLLGDSHRGRFESRKEDVAKPGVLMDMIVRPARELKTQNRTPNGLLPAVLPEAPEFDAFREADDFADEEDVTIDVEDTNDPAEHDIEYEEAPSKFLTAVRDFVEVMGQEPIIVKEVEDQRCVLCLKDDTMPAEAKMKVWPNATKLRYHQRTRIHSRRMLWITNS